MAGRKAAVVTYLIVIPAYNSAKLLVELLPRVRRAAPDLEILVVDDGSTDSTRSVVESSGASVLSLPENRGKGEALRTGFAEGLRRGADAVVQMDADGQHAPEYLPRFFAAFERGEGDVIMGTRDFRVGNMPLLRRLSNVWTSWAISRMAGVRIADSQSGYRLLSRRALEMIKPQSGRFAYESEYLILAGRAGLKIGSVPISTVYHGEGSFIRIGRDAPRFLQLVWRHGLHGPRRTRR